MVLQENLGVTLCIFLLFFSLKSNKTYIDVIVLYCHTRDV